MIKQRFVDFKDSNIAGIGTDADKELRKKAAGMEAEWKGAGTKLGVEIWRVESFAVKRIDPKTHGTFYGGDSYIILHTYGNAPKFQWNVHFWLGKDTSQDEAGVAAYKTVELDDVLGGGPVQFREVMGHETQAFIDLFPNGLRILSGGVESGFHHVKPEEYVPRLLQVKGNKEKNVRLFQVECKASALNDGDVFVLDGGMEIVIWHGSKSSFFERRKAEEAVRLMIEERNGRPKREIIDATDDHDYFWKTLGGKQAPKSAEAGGADDVKQKEVTKLMQLSDASGHMQLSEDMCSGKKPTKAMLDKNDVFIMDVGHSIYVWIGSGASKDERANAMNYASRYLVHANLPFHVPVIRLIEGGETAQFNSYFA